MDVEFTDYAVGRMRKRDILYEEVLRALEASPSKHRHREDGRSEVVDRFGNRRLMVVYRREAQTVVVINVMWE